MNNAAAIKKYVGATFPDFGVNKKQEITRLLYEIAKREGIFFENILEEMPQPIPDFFAVKKYLMGRRFPSSLAESKDIKFYFPELNIDKHCRVKIKKSVINPQNVYIEEGLQNSFLTGKFKEKFKNARFILIPSLKEHLKDKKFDLSNHNKRRENFFIVREKYDFFKKCPCTTNAFSCGYHIFNLGFGCIFECAYCYLQEYINTPGIILPANIEDFFRSFEKYRHNIRLGTGEFADSLALDDITGFSPLLVDFFRKHPECVFEFKTKSANIKNLLSVEPAKNVVVAWSLNPQNIINDNEFYSASLRERLEAACKCAENGFDVAFHFDPIFYYSGWEKDYEKLIEVLFDKIKSKYVRWISLGTFRFPRNLKKIIENRFPENKILDAELYPGFDGKIRYSENVRVNIYKKMLEWIKKRGKNVFVYLCMEEKDICGECGLTGFKESTWKYGEAMNI